MTNSPAMTAAKIAAENRFPNADLSSPDIVAWMNAFAANWETGARGVREGLSRILDHPNAWAHRDMVFALYLEADASEETVVKALNALPPAPKRRVA